MQQRINAMSVWLLLSGVFAASLLLPLPASTGRIAHLPSICLFYNLTGLPCPGCGLTRAFVCIGHGQWRESLHWHPLGWLIYGIFGLLWLRCGLFWILGITFLSMPPHAVRRLSATACIVLLLTGAVRIGWLLRHHLQF
ncbi:MAG: DUF2752 domain-containing protein [Janthinobacterium lividum]